MALKKCKECGKEVSTQAKRCPGCGAPAPVSDEAKILVVFVLIVVGILWLISISNGANEQRVKSFEKENATKVPLITHVGKHNTAEQYKIAKKAFEIFQQECFPLMNDYVNDIEKIELYFNVRKGDCNWYYRCEQYGWMKEVEIKIEIKNNTSQIPFKHRAWGHTLYYYLGAGNQPGIVAQKSQSQLVCGMRDVHGNDVFKAVEALAFIDE